ncbi:C-terminal processing protease CtpA/Prc [Ulvibacter sp. MAR_2010_11]|uniref:S41 family peptidase n=1 Tax=Ulvibacter sp. MAR_2010_11 TaxID=1250229 RepID=UPI000C2C4BD5|nr:S41 family peptidase [Ulvibacter sp. MAR_2010_11]PKA83946.1 C-terminal processing protease CtpA/Prc [Ulvibacter sp. MAR_2010_11]
MKKKFLVLLLVVSVTFTSCFTDKDDTIQISSALDIQNFIYRGLNFFYLYKADTPELANDAFATTEARDAFLNSFDSPESLFDFLKSSQDRFSLLVDDYIALENALNGISLSNGMEFGLVRYPDQGGNVFGYVRYVIPNTSAATEGLQRGMIFNTVDGQQITETNFNALLSPETYSIGLATFDGQTVTPTGESKTLTKTQVSENPIYIAQTLTVNSQKIGYLMYNAFTGTFDTQLNAAFGQFKADGITDLILDLRYNGGGSVRTAQDLSSMITGQFAGQLFYSEQWNEDRQADYAEDGVFNTTLSTGEAINSLNLTRVYILTTGRSASASELVINSLDPYIQVIQVGGTTTGKFQASFLLYDAPAPNFSRNQANPGHTYAMLPLVFKTANAAGNTDFIDGLFPDIQLNEDYSNLGTLGDVNEPLLAAALNDIFPTPQPARNSVPTLEEVSESKATLPNYQIMIAEH